MLRSRRNSSAPGPNGIPNTIWKRCAVLKEHLYRVIKRVWTIKEIPSSWQCATVRLFHKEGPADNPGNFRPIALSNCEGKIFFGLISQCAQQHMIKNKFFDHRLQKGFMPGVSGCLEHTTLLTEALRDAREHQRSICISWLDLRNAFGSVHHSFVLFALWHYRFLEFIRQLFRSYYGFLRIVVDVPACFRTKPIHFAIGVFQGCTLSPVLFNIVIQLALDMLEQRMHQSFAYQLACNPQITLLASA